MRATHRFYVDPDIPPSLAPLHELATNLHWTWDAPTQEIFARLDPDASDASGHDPVRFLELVAPARWAELGNDDRVVADVAARARDVQHALSEDRWFQSRAETPLRLVAYFSPEFGITETLAQYSGGLGVLAGDHLKAASDLGLPLVAVGLLYREGYFHQRLDADGFQTERFPPIDPASTGLVDTGARIDVDLAGQHVTIAVWRVDVGRIPLYLLDANVEGNPPAARSITDRLYGGDVEHRLCQEIVLGIGGVRALRALGHDPQVFHTNEGHAGFLALERIREHVSGGLAFPEAIEAVRAGGLFTTHTPVPAGIDRYPLDLMAKYFTGYAAELGATFDELIALGRSTEEPDGPRFNMAVMGLRLACRSNAVARLHGDVSRQMFHHLWPGALVDEVPIGHVTNGVHAKTWVAPRVDALLTRCVHGVWDGADATTWQGVTEASDDELWQARAAGRAELVHEVRRRLRADVLDPATLTIGFARRFATYKRATLLLSQPERLARLLRDEERPVQFVFAGKAHPADQPGKEMIQQIERFARGLDVAHRFVFVPDYDMGVARTMYHGCDVWLNNPRRPLEACGTSGMKAALNGALNCSILDGWWDECADGTNGWIIASADGDLDPARRDEREALNLFNILETDLVPLFYDGEPPVRWLARMRHGWATLGPFVTASRMVRDYTTSLYEPAASAAERIHADHWAGARDLAGWKRRVATAWPQVAIVHHEADNGKVQAVVALGPLDPGEIVCEVVHGRTGPDGELISPIVEPMSLVAREDRGARYASTFDPASAGPYGVSVRVRPTHPLLTSPVETALVTWAG